MAEASLIFDLTKLLVVWSSIKTTQNKYPKYYTMTETSENNPPPANEVVRLRAVDHIFIRDLDTGEIILNQRGDSTNIGNDDDR